MGHPQNLHISLDDDKKERDHSCVIFLFMCLCVWPMLMVCLLAYSALFKSADHLIDHMVWNRMKEGIKHFVLELIADKFDQHDAQLSVEKEARRLASRADWNASSITLNVSKDL